MKHPRLSDAALAGAGVLWGASFPLGKLALGHVGPGWLVIYRFVLGFAVLAPFVDWRALRLERRDVLALVGTAFLVGPAMFLVQFEGLARTTASSAALLVATLPPMMALGGALLDRERPSRLTLYGIAMASVGVALMTGVPGPGRSLLGDALVFISLIVSVAWTLTTRRIVWRLGALRVTVLQFLLGAAWMLPFALIREGSPPIGLSTSTAWIILALGVACTAASFALWNWGLQHSEAARAGIFGNIEPVVGAAIGVLILGDVLGPWAVVGGLIAIAAATLVTIRPAPPRATPA